MHRAAADAELRSKDEDAKNVAREDARVIALFAPLYQHCIRAKPGSDIKELGTTEHLGSLSNKRL